MKLLSLSDYIQDATKEIKGASRRVYVMTLCIAKEERTKEFMEALSSAASRDVEVFVAADLFTYSEFGGHFSPFKKYTKRSRQVTDFTNSLVRAGVDFTWLGGNQAFNPFAGVTHIKWTIVDDIVYAFGGVNLYGRGAKNVDYMFKVKDALLADTLVREHKKIVQADRDPTSYQGFRKTTEFGTLLIDSGQRNQSDIYNRAVELAEQCESLLFVSQYCPTGEIAKLVKQKASGVYFNLPTNAHILTDLMIRGSQLVTGIKNQYKSHRYLHAKFIIFTMPSGKKIALSGSHNFSYGGVRLGTREVEIETHNQADIRQLEAFLKENVP